MHLMSYRDLSGLGFSEDEVKAIAAEYKVADTNDAGEPIERTALPSDKFHNPFPNDKAAAAANGGKVPPDLSLMAKARGEGGETDGPNYIYRLPHRLPRRAGRLPGAGRAELQRLLPRPRHGDAEHPDRRRGDLQRRHQGHA